MMWRSANRLGEVKEYYFSKKLKEIDELRAQGTDVLNLGIGNPDLPPHPSVVKALTETSSQENIHGYQSYKGIPALREGIANWYARKYNVHLDPHAEILPLSGSKEGIMHIHMALINPGDEVLIPDPAYPAYASCAKLAGAVVKHFDLLAENNFQPDFDQLAKLVTKRTKMIWINYPHMPTGAKANSIFFKALISFAQKHQIIICHDNPYSFILNDKPVSILEFQGAKSCCIELNSLSKTYNMAGWRIGFVCAANQLIEQLLRFKSNMDSGMYLPLQKGAIEAMKLDDSWHKRLNDIYADRRILVHKLLDKLGCTYNTDQVGLFVWAKRPAHIHNTEQWIDELLNRLGIFITPGSIFGRNGEKFVRVSLCNAEKTLALAIRRIEMTRLKYAV